MVESPGVELAPSSNSPELQRLCRALEYEFRNESLLEMALTHRSAVGENYERLEFLGDAVLDYVISHELYHRYPRCNEGELSRLRSTLVNRDMLARIAQRIVIGEHLKLGPGELKSGGFRRSSILADALEAIFGAISLDSSFAQARAVILRLYKPCFEELPELDQLKDPKTRLQELLQARRMPLPSYSIVREEGSKHARIYVVECESPALPGRVEGRGSSRRKAEQAAAQEAFRILTEHE